MQIPAAKVVLQDKSVSVAVPSAGAGRFLARRKYAGLRNDAGLEGVIRRSVV